VVNFSICIVLILIAITLLILNSNLITKLPDCNLCKYYYRKISKNFYTTYHICNKHDIISEHSLPSFILYCRYNKICNYFESSSIINGKLAHDIYYENLTKILQKQIKVRKITLTFQIILILLLVTLCILKHL
jgi:hypothetical protein